MNKKIYKEIIENTIVPSNITSDEKIIRYERITQFMNQNTPKRLYRFRSASEQNISAFYKDEIWFSSGNKMNDDFEARIFYDKKKIRAELMNLISESGELKVIASLRKNDEIPLEMFKIVPHAMDVFSWIKTVPEEQTIAMSRKVIEYILDNLDIGLKFVENRLQESSRFACFSEQIYSDMMWGHYASNAQGFALEYVIDRYCNVFTESGTAGTYNVTANLFPIIYDNRRLDGTSYALYLFQIYILQLLYGQCLPTQWLNTLVPCPDEFMGTKIAIKKSRDWASEREWRVFYIPDFSEDSKKNNFIHIKPKAIYLGRKISDINQKVLIDIAKEKGIPAYKMYIKDDLDSYKLSSCKIKIK